MARYYDVDKILKKIKEFYRIKPSGDTFMDIFCAFNENNCKQIIEEVIKELPTADVVEVKHGEWELKSEIHRYLEEFDEEFYVECPFCNRVYYVPFEFEDEKMIEYAKKNYPYCNCGAKMDGKDTNVPTKEKNDFKE